ncbi:MAG: murein hydrolase transporter LrgA [Rhodobacteraceae bacterium]|nr:murein hydrolase transporter LrgA [Paracoccaceae bacterium]QEW18399.1 Antiholin-like protein LrgA [Marinibacterium anthonyi]
MLGYLTLIFTCQLIGELITHALALPIPGPVIGMVVLFLVLVLRGRVPDGLDKVSATLLQYLSLLFVPAGTGVMLHFRLIEASLVPITLSLLVSTLLTIAVTSVLMSWLSKARPGGQADV